MIATSKVRQRGVLVGTLAAALFSSGFGEALELRGRITMDGTTPVENALLRVFATETGREHESPAKILLTQTTKDGTYALSGLRKGSYVLHVSVRSYLAYGEVIILPDVESVTKNMDIEAARRGSLLEVTILNADDDLKVVLNGVPVVTWSIDGERPKFVALWKPDNTIELRVYNRASFTGGLEVLGGHQPEGWNYHVKFNDSDGRTLGEFKDGEDRPQANGPRHGREFSVMRGMAKVDGPTGQIKFREVRLDVWRSPGDSFRIDPKGWCCAGGSVFPGTSRTCTLKQGTFHPTQDAARRACPPVIR